MRISARPRLPDGDRVLSPVATLKDAGIIQSTSKKGNCIDDGATEQVFDHLKDEFFREGYSPTSSPSRRILTPT